MASHQGHGKVVRVLLDAYRTRSPSNLTSFVNAKDILGRTPLHYACAGGHVGVVKELLGQIEVDPCVRDKVIGLVPVHLAACIGDHAVIVKLLLGVPASDPNAQVASDEDAVMTSAMSQLQTNDEVPELPRPKLEEAVRQTSFTWKERNPWNEEYEIVLSIGGGTALHLACQQNHITVVEALLQHSKVEANPVDNNGMTPLHYAAGEGHLEVLKVMLSESTVHLNAQVRAPGKYWHEKAYRLDTPLHLAVRKGRLSAVKELCGNPNLRPNIENWKHRTALHLTWVTHHDSREGIRDLLLARPEEKKYVGEKEMSKQSLQNSANGLLVVGTLMAGLSFTATITPPASISVDSMSPSLAPSSLGDVVDRLPVPLRKFWWFNHLTFFFSLVGFTAAIACLLPPHVSSKNLFVAAEVVRLHRLVVVSTVLVLKAFFLVSCAFLSVESANLGGSFPGTFAKLVGSALLAVAYSMSSFELIMPNVSSVFKTFGPDPLGLAADVVEMRACKDPSSKQAVIKQKLSKTVIEKVIFPVCCTIMFFKLYGA